jgi:hypothetical protein
MVGLLGVVQLDLVLCERVCGRVLLAMEIEVRKGAT